MKKEIKEAINKYNKAPGIDSFESELFKEDTKNGYRPELHVLFTKNIGVRGASKELVQGTYCKVAKVRG